MSKNRISIDVVIPVFNGEHTIRKTLESILNQSKKPCHIIIVNDGSTDNSIREINSLTQNIENIILVETENLGRSSARNTGISYSDAEYIAFLDSDDEWLPNRLQQAEYRILDSGTKAYACGYLTRKQSGLYHGRKNRPRAAISFQNLINQVSFIPGSASSAIVAREILETPKLFPEDRSYAEDLVAWCKIASITQWEIDTRELVIVNENSDNSRYDQISAFNSQLSRLENFSNLKFRLSNRISLIYARGIDSRTRLRRFGYAINRNHYQKIDAAIFRIAKTFLLIVLDSFSSVIGLFIYVGYTITYGAVTREKRKSE